MKWPFLSSFLCTLSNINKTISVLCLVLYTVFFFLTFTVGLSISLCSGYVFSKYHVIGFQFFSSLPTITFNWISKCIYILIKLPVYLILIVILFVLFVPFALVVIFFVFSFGLFLLFEFYSLLVSKLYTLFLSFPWLRHCSMHA